jgi:hypothetical protein
MSMCIFHAWILNISFLGKSTIFFFFERLNFIHKVIELKTSTVYKNNSYIILHKGRIPSTPMTSPKNPHNHLNQQVRTITEKRAKIQIKIITRTTILVHPTW